ncbi:hypothetical protein [Candidatus Enterococcus murrayae]|uniref:Uncharacterized protein n=1 Tax=Candidatus Enterococcus murrayae TaxID=2815321 RepID=A0ABS3HK04_9ENTE|nr:hypothetical protein [Enterococcus sp. MJM16]MBO0453770.1 hypothetical protein [Enterococcus sp. MJM16]
MAPWTAKLTVMNTTNQDLKLVSKYVCARNSIVSFPTSIPAKSKAVFEVITPYGEASGPEFKISLVAQAKDNQRSLGSFDFHVDIPYWSPKNTLHYHCNRDLLCQVIPGMIYDRDQSYNGEVIISALEITDMVNKKVLNEKVQAKSFQEF